MRVKMDKKQIYLGLVREWSERMNLVAKSTLADLESRHWDDSAQLAEFIEGDPFIIDLGSGAGFPGVVLAILGFRVICVESIAKKANFLIEVKNRLGLDNLTVWNDRIENKMPEIQRTARREGSLGRAIIFTARAFASLDKILSLTKSVKNAEYLLLKGRTVEDEIAQARRKFRFDYKLTPSKFGDGFVVEIRS